MTERLVKRTILIPLTEKELAEVAVRASEIHTTLAHMRFEARESANGFKNRIAGLQDDLNAIMSIIRNKSEMREVSCLEVMDFERKVVNYLLDEKVVETRSLTGLDSDDF